jgi:ParB family chromosome partitioning protein
VVATQDQAVSATAVVEIPIDRIKVTTRLRPTDETKIRDLTESIRGVGLLHAITVSQKGDEFHLLAGNHRLESAKSLGWTSIPATINDADPLIEELIEIEENLISHRLSPLSEALHIVRWEEILSKLGKRAATGDNRWNRSGLTNSDLAKSRGMAKSTYLMTKTIAKLNPEVQDIIEVSDFEYNKMDLVALVKENDEVQLEVANLIATGKCTTFKRALTLARIKCHPFNWSAEQSRVKELVGKPYSVMKWDGDTSDLSLLCKLVKEDEKCKVLKQQWGTEQAPLAAQHPDHSAHFINFYSKPGDLLLDGFCGRGSNVLVGAALGRKVVGYDLSPQNLETVRSVALENTDIGPDDLTLHHGCGVELKEYQDQEDVFDLISSDPPFLFGIEPYGTDPRDLCTVKDLDGYVAKMTTCMTNLKRLIKTSNWDKKEFHPIVMKVGSSRRGEKGFIDLATEFELIGRQLGLSLHDKVINILNSQWAMFNVSRCIDNRYSVKIHETTLVFIKY